MVVLPILHIKSFAAHLDGLCNPQAKLSHACVASPQVLLHPMLIQTLTIMPQSLRVAKCRHKLMPSSDEMCSQVLQSSPVVTCPLSFANFPGMKRPPPPPPPPSGAKGTPPPPPPLSGLKKPPGIGKKMTEIDTPAGVTKVNHRSLWCIPETKLHKQSEDMKYTQLHCVDVTCRIE